MRTTWFIGAACLLVVGACSSEEGAQTAAAESPAPAAGKVGDLFGATAGLPLEVAKASWGQPKAAVLGALGWASASYVDSKRAQGVTYSLVFEDGAGLVAVEVSSGTALEPILTDRWGKPSKSANGEAFWFDAEAGVRAWLPEYGSGQTLKLTRYAPIEQVLGTSGKGLAFAQGKALLGATVAELRQSWGQALCRFDEQAPKVANALAEYADSPASLDMALRSAELSLCLPMRDMTTRQRLERLRIGRDGKVQSLSMTIASGGTDALRASLIALMDAKWGAAVEAKRDDGQVRRYFDADGGMQVTATFHDEDAGLWFQRYRPASALFQSDGPGLSFETEATIGGTFAEIQASDREHFRAHGDRMASLYYPPVEYSNELLEVQLKISHNKERTHGYRVVLHYDEDPAFGERIFAMLEAKFGAPKRDESRSSEGEHFLFEKDGRKVAAWRVSKQWQISVTAAK